MTELAQATLEAEIQAILDDYDRQYYTLADAGVKMKRTICEAMKENGLWAARSIYVEYLAIEQKKSGIPATARAAVVEIVQKAVTRSIIKIQTETAENSPVEPRNDTGATITPPKIETATAAKKHKNNS